MAVTWLDVIETSRYPNPLEIAKIIAKGAEYTQWETVWIQHRWADSSALFRFTCAELSPIPIKWIDLKLMPGDPVNITLGGQSAIVKGFITDRQVAYGASEHSVQLSGRSFSWLPATSSVDVPNGNLDNMNFLEVAQTVLKPFGITPKIIGDPGQPKFTEKYPYLRVDKGALVWNFLETIARPRGIVLGSDYAGNILIIGDHTTAPNTRLVEGVNILQCQCIFSKQNLFSVILAVGQTNGSDDVNGKDASEQESQPVKGQGIAPRKLIVPAPVPVRTTGELQEIAINEAKWTDGDLIQASIKTQGWMRPGTSTLWTAGDTVVVYSPMAVLLDMPMKIQTVTFEQSRAGGTTSTLDLVMPWLLNDRIELVPFQPTAPEIAPQQTPQPQPQPQH